MPVTRNANGAAIIETYSVRYDWPTTTGVIIGRLDADGSRFMALTEDEDLVALMTDGDPLGARITVKSTDEDDQPGFARLEQCRLVRGQDEAVPADVTCHDRVLGHQAQRVDRVDDVMPLWQRLIG